MLAILWATSAGAWVWMKNVSTVLEKSLQSLQYILHMVCNWMYTDIIIKIPTLLKTLLYYSNQNWKLFDLVNARDAVGRGESATSSHGIDLHVSRRRPGRFSQIRHWQNLWPENRGGRTAGGRLTPVMAAPAVRMTCRPRNWFRSGFRPQLAAPATAADGHCASSGRPSSLRPPSPRSSPLLRSTCTTTVHGADFTDSVFYRKQTDWTR